jgi:hypothetical protein
MLKNEIMCDIFQAVEVVKHKIMDADPNIDRNMQIRRCG